MSGTNGAAGAPQVGPALPPLYQGLEPLTAERHGSLRLRDVGFTFAAEAPAIPLTAEEFTAAARTLPIVFASQTPHLPVVITSLTGGGNRFVSTDGTWRAGAYIPAYLRRMPFFLVRMAPQSQELVLCLDPRAPQVSETEGEALFTDGKPTPAVQRALDFSRAVDEAVRRTEAMVARLTELNLLQPATLQLERNGGMLRVDGFHAVDRPALAALPHETLAELRDKGWLEPIYAHLVSLQTLSELPPTA